MNTLSMSRRLRTWNVLGTAVLSLGLVLASDPSEAARRTGGGNSIGMQRSVPTQKAAPQPTSPTAQPGQTAAAPAAAPSPAAAGAPAKQPNRWLGPIAGLAAGLGLAALMSHLGLGEGMAQILMIALLAFAGFAVVRWVMNRSRAGAPVGRPQPAWAGAGAGAAGQAAPEAPTPRSASDTGVSAFQAQAPQGAAAAGQELSVTGRPLRSYNSAEAVASSGSGAAAVAALSVPAGFDVPGFEKIARALFIRMQAAYDAADLNDLRRFTTPEVFAQLRMDIQDRGPQAQASDVQEVQAELLDFVDEADRQIVTVRFQGRIAEAPQATAEAFDEMWHLVKAKEGDGAWAIAGIQQVA